MAKKIKIKMANMKTGKPISVREGINQGKRIVNKIIKKDEKGLFDKVSDAYKKTNIYKDASDRVDIKTGTNLMKRFEKRIKKDPKNKKIKLKMEQVRDKLRKDVKRYRKIKSIKRR